MAIYKGDYPASHTAVTLPFDSFAAATGAPSAVTNFAAGDVQIYKDGGTTQRSSSAGITVTTSFDSQTGEQMVVIDLSDNTDAGFYAAGHEYDVFIQDITVDGQTLRFYLGAFSIERAGGVLALLKAGTAKVTLADGVAHGGTLGSSTATLALSRASIVSQSSNTAALTITGNGSGNGSTVTGGATGIGLAVVGGGTSGDGIKVTTTSGHGINLAPVGSSMHGLFVTGGNGGTSDGFKAVAGTGGVPIRGDITANITGTLATVTTLTNLPSVTSNWLTAAGIADGAIDNATFAADTGLKTARSNTLASATGTTAVLDASASAVDSFYLNGLLVITGGTGVGQARLITVYVGSTKTCTVATWVTNPDNTSTYAIIPLDASASGTAPTAAQVATAVWQDTTAGDFTVASSIGKCLFISNVAPGGSGGHMISGSNSGTTTLGALTVTGAATFTGGIVGAITGNITGNLSGSVGSVTGAVGSVTGSVGSVTGAVGSVTGAVGSVTGNVGGNVVGSVASVTAGVTLTANQLFIKKNAIATAFMFKMVLATDNITAATGKTVTATRSIDGAAFGACANSVTEVSSGWYKITLAAADTNGTFIALHFTAALCNARDMLVVTQA